MRYIKTFEDKIEYNAELLKELIDENPLSKDNDFYIFIAKNNFVEEKDGRYKKSIEIERMVKITPDDASIAAMKGMTMRVRFNIDSKLYHIWLPKELEEDVNGKGYSNLEPWLVDLIDTHKKTGSSGEGREIFNSVINRKKIADKFNL